jgi:hypothetical protein
MRMAVLNWMAVAAVVSVLGIGALLPNCAAPAAAYQLPDTGQTKCYDNTQEIPCPQSGQVFYGQDGNYQGPQPSYRDNGDGMVTDLNTGLMWQQGDSQNDGVGRAWQDAVDYCASLDLANHTDWHLPTKLELISLVDVGIFPGPTVNTTYFPHCRSNDYWSSSAHANIPGVAWAVHFDSGYVNPHYKSDSLYVYVRCVRVGP